MNCSRVVKRTADEISMERLVDGLYDVLVEWVGLDGSLRGIMLETSFIMHRSF